MSRESVTCDNLGIVVPEVPELLSRDITTNLFGALIRRPLVGALPCSVRQPVLVYEGTRGAGKTAVLASLARRLAQRVPYALLDFEANQQVSVPEVLSALAFELSNACPNYPHLRFARLLTGLVIMRERLDLDDHGQARTQVVALLAQRRRIEQLRGILRAVAANVAVIVRQRTGVQVEELVGLVDDVVVPGLPRWRLTQPIVLGTVYEWYGHREQGLTNDAIDELIKLNRWRRQVEDTGSPAAQQQIDELLVDAFLTDLCAEFGTARQPKHLVVNCVVLLDNVDTALGRHFLGELVSARRQRVIGRRLDPEPLTVVATSRGVALADAPRDEVFEADGELGPVKELLGRRGGRPPHWLRHSLPDLGKDDVRGMVNALALAHGTNPVLTELIWRLSHGHPAMTDLLVAALAVRPEHCDEPARVLYEPEPDEHANRRLMVGERATAVLLGDFPREAVTDLITCASAVTREDAILLATLDERLPDGTPLLAASTANYLAVVDPVLWPVRAGAGPVALRRLLLGRLAQRGTSVEQPGVRRPGWVEVFGWHRDRCADAGDETGGLYYALASGELTAVADGLLRRLTEQPARHWLVLLDRVVRAPHRPHHVAVPVASPSEELDAMVRGVPADDEWVRVMAGLTAGAQLLASPFTGSHRKSVHLELAANYDRLAPKCPSGRELLFERAQDHRKEAEKWR